MGPGVFLAMSGAYGLLPSDQTHLKKALCHIRPVLGRMINTRSNPRVWPAFPVV